jgi:hypothetical protein
MRQSKSEAVEVFRQFAWHLAGQLSLVRGGRKRPPKLQGRT